MFDIFIIGGGINGSGVARDATGRGYKVGLAEQFDFGFQTSSWSTKLIHGGIRYLENYEFKLVRESLREREIIFHIAKNISKPLDFVLPHVPSLRPSWLIQIGLKIYDYLSNESKLPRSKKINLNQLDSFISDEFKFGYQYSDLQIDDSRLTLLNLLDAQNRGAEIFNYTKVEKVQKLNGLWEINLSNGKTLRSKILVNASGPMIKDSFQNVFQETSNYEIKLVQGSHIVTNKLYEGSHAYILQQSDRRIVFIIPYLEKFSLIGTTELEVDSPFNPQITPEEESYLLDCVNNFSKNKINKDDIVWKYAGVRPLISEKNKSSRENTRDYHLDINLKEKSLINIFGGKLTTFRKLSEKLVDQIDSYNNKRIFHWTHDEVLPGNEELISLNDSRLDNETLNRITKTYGGLGKEVLKYLDKTNGKGIKICETLYEFEIQYLIEKEFVKNAEDVLFRRTKIGIKFNTKEIHNTINLIISGTLKN